MIRSKIPKLQKWLLVAGILSLLIVIILFIFRASNSWPVASRGVVSVETSFTTIEAKHLPIFTRNDNLLIASTSGWAAPGQIAIGNRQTQEVFLFPESEIEQSKSWRKLALGQIWKADGLQTLETFILDIANFDSDFYVSSVGAIESGDLKGNCAYIAVDQIALTAQGGLSFSRIWKSPFCLSLSDTESPGWHDLHGRLVVNDSNIFLATGALLNETYEGTFPNRGLSQLPEKFEDANSSFEFFGRLLSIDRASGEFETLAEGFRGPSGLAADVDWEYFLIADHGPRGGDEINMVARESGSSNEGVVPHFGWPYVSLGSSYSAPTGDFSEVIDTSFDNHVGFVPPLFSWMPGIAPSQVIQIPHGGTKVLGPNFREGDWIVTSLKAASIFHIRLSDSRLSVLYSEQIPIGSRIRDISLSSDGFFLSTDDGQIIKLRQMDSPPTGIGAFPPVQPGSPIYDSEVVKFLRVVANAFLDWISFKG